MIDAQIFIDEAIAGLKDFQKETVDYVMRQFYDEGRKKVLIADEVGLGKTIVSRGVVACMFQKHLKNKNAGFNVIYICSNQAIAKQNVGKLNFFHGEEAKGVVENTYDDDRLTALSYEPTNRVSNYKLHIKAFTPATSFDQNSQTGRSDERALLYRLLFKHPNLQDRTNSLKWFLKGDGRMDNANWDKVIEDANLYENDRTQKHKHIGQYRKIREGLRDKYFKKLNSKLPIKYFRDVYDFINEDRTDTIIGVLIKICGNAIRKNNYLNTSSTFKPLLSHLRLKLSECCKDYLQADLFILDEFQRYSQLLSINETENPGVELARQVLSKKNSRVLMLSATPFKPYTNDFDELNGESHFKEFDKVLKFLLKDKDEAFWSELENERKKLFDFIRHPQKLNQRYDECIKVKKGIETKYHSVIARTERMMVSKNKDAMVKPSVRVMDIREEDIADFVAFDKIIRFLNDNHNTNLQAPIEYTKSSPYPLSFLGNYEHRKKLEEYYPKDKLLQKIVNSTRDSWVNLSLVKSYKPIFDKKKNSIPNPKIRLLLEETIGDSGWKYLWIPPCIFYFEPEKIYLGSEGYTKTLIFSSWKLVPRMISTVVSYEAERLSVGNFISRSEGRTPNYFAKRRYPFPLLTFKSGKEEDSLSSMNNFMLNYPSTYLSRIYNPQENLADKLSITAIKKKLAALIHNRLLELNVFELGQIDGDWQKWSWYALLLLDKHDEGIEYIRLWLNDKKSTEEVSSDVENESDKQSRTAKSLYFNEVIQVLCHDKMPNVSKISESQLLDVCDFLADLCLGSPAICAFRSMKQLFRECIEKLLPNAYLIAAGFISLFNKPESIAVVQLIKSNKEYYRKVLDYSIDGNIQSMLDEYFYMLKDSNSVKDPIELASLVATILSIRPSTLDVSTINSLKKNKSRNSIRTHFGLDFGEQKLRSAKANRQINIREAFNSPFRPFVLASTSIGQEGLDFHFYCKKIVHWNLPTNPIDFEQREGRIHRYKGHVIRLNIIEKYLSQLQFSKKNQSFIWDHLFEVASEIESKSVDFKCELVPCWHLEPENNKELISIDRIVPLFPFSKDIGKYYDMLKVLAYYRFTFGQPRQEELIQILADNGNLLDLNKLAINLSPISYDNK